MNWSELLNESQAAAVTAPDGPVLAIAAAGTGKTRTLTCRVAHLVCEREIPPDRILLLTFTNKAADEMLERARSMAGDEVSGLWGGTFHHLANRLLRRHADRLGFGLDYTILDSDDTKKLLRTVTLELGLKGKHFPKPGVLSSVFGVAANTERGIEDLAREWFEDSDVQPEQVVDVYHEYEQRKRSLNSMDFDDLLIHALNLIRDQQDLREQYQERFRYILVDEYQDTSAIQAEWVDLLAGGHRNLMVVGDDFQSIYSWRGANYRNILHFQERYPDARVYKLETNYRSSPEILEVANRCIAGNPHQFQKNLRAVREHAPRPRLARMLDSRRQARYVLQRVREFERNGVSLEDMAVLYRSHFHALDLQLELTRENLPFTLTSGVRFFEQAHIKDVCTLLRLLENPGDELAFARLLEMFPKVGAKTAQKIWDKIGRRFRARSPDECVRVRDSLPSAAKASWMAAEPIFLAYREEGLDEDPGEIVFRFVREFYREYAVETFDNARNRLEDIDALIDFTSRYTSTQQFLSETALLSSLESTTSGPGADAGGLRLSTIHQAKGLEWKIVFVIWLSEEMFPSARAEADTEKLAEERRLFYVATTRAEDRLFLCTPERKQTRDGGLMPCEPSRFLRELPAECVELEL
ncbi:ATP-dependent helicase [Kiritimatiella glycovorans]|uniref:DNA 3'-5' helicase n=1 Tax=Kiritimatiella glycovorans TaxID=1307763 RepID=A0A0G3EGS2_9BACT|nr:ATP-dependent helicase [Kiritimatiella glycovorans]AKJ65553.1 ATP-dependent DNA helicase PcrA [Kiritimatiella glycovorans]